jgi:hypothetical protein
LFNSLTVSLPKLKALFISSNKMSLDDFSDFISIGANDMPYLRYPARSQFNSGEFTITLESLKKHIPIILSDIESLRFTWNQDNYEWDIEFGTAPFENGKPELEYNQIINGKMNALKAASVAVNKFPHLINYNDNEVHPISHFRWSIMKLRLYRTNKTGSILIELNRMAGESSAYIHIWKRIKSYLDEIMILLQRIPYLAFAESIPENVTGFDNKIINEYWLRELCEYVS